MTSPSDTDNLPDELSFPHERYEALALLGAGATGSVFKCHDKTLGRTVSIKTLKNLTENQVIDFQREARALSTVQHPGIVSILDFGVTENGFPYLVMEYIEGETLATRLAREVVLKTSTALGIFVEVARALEYVHTKGIFHRDIKPSNILVYEDKSGQPHTKLIDFGIAAIAQNEKSSAEAQGSTIVGTPSYMSPDQVKGEDYDAASETYSLACVLFETLVGVPPFSAATPLQLFSLHANQPAPPLSDFNTPSIIFPRLDQIVRKKALSKDKQDRYTSMAEFGEALASLIDEATSYEMDVIQYGAREVWQPGDLAREKELRSINVRYTLVFVACLVAVVSVIPVIAFAILNQNELASQEKSKGRLQLRSNVDIGSFDYLVGQLDKDGISVRGNVCKISSSLDPELLKQKSARHHIDKISILGTALTPEDAKVIATIRPRHLELRHCNYSEEVIKILSEIDSVNSLAVTYCVLSEASMKSIASMPQLAHLDLSYTTVNDRGIAMLANHKTPFELDVRACKSLTGSGLRQGMQNLQSLKIGGSGISGHDLSFLKSMPSLAMLAASPIDITDAQMKQFEDLHLQLVSIDGPNLSMTGLRSLLKMPSLQTIETEESETITRDGINALRRERPDLRIKFTVPRLNLLN